MTREILIHSDAEAVYQQQCRTLQSIARQLGREAETQAMRELCLKDPWFLAQHAFNFYFMDKYLHGRVFASHYRKALLAPGMDIMTLVPRGHCKTTWLSVFLVQEILNNPDIAIAIVSGTEKLAKLVAKLIADTLRNNEVLQRCFPDILPNAEHPPSNWGVRGYFLPNRQGRIDPTLVVGSVTSNVTGTHPDILVLDDIVYGASESQLEAAENAYIEAMAIMPPHGRVIINGTRWHDADLYGKILEGRYSGNLGEYKTLIMGCWEPDGQTPVYPKKPRNNQRLDSGFSRDDLLRRKANNAQFFFCQYLNDPAPQEAAVLRVDDIVIYEPSELPEYLPCYSLGVETNGPAVSFPALFQGVCESYSLSIPIIEINSGRLGNKGEGKQNRLLTTLSPLFENKQIRALKWMIEERGQLGDEVRRFGKAKHDDIIDALHMVPLHLACGIHPAHGQPAVCYISVDLAFSVAEDRDFTVFMAIVVDSRNQYWIADYKRFQERNPLQIAQQLIRFYQQINSKARGVEYNKKRANKFALSYR